MVYQGNDYEYLSLLDITSEKSHVVAESKATDVTFIWNTGGTMNIVVDNVEYKIMVNEIIILSSFRKIERVVLEKARIIRFNKSFFCVLGQDAEKTMGIQFFRKFEIPVVSICDDHLNSFELSWEIFCSEMQSKDNHQKQMLLSILKRILILCARNLKRSNSPAELNAGHASIVREFNYLVENHFLKHHDVAFYASKLNKSPKTLSNLFSALSGRAPINIIHDRIMIHARRQITNTELSIKEIAYELGYEDIQTFSRFFKNKEGISPAHYRAKVSTPRKILVSA